MLSDVKIKRTDIPVDPDSEKKLKMIDDLAEKLGLKTLILIGLPVDDLDEMRDRLDSKSDGSVTIIRGDEKSLVYALGQACIVDGNFKKVIEKYGEFNTWNSSTKAKAADLMDGIFGSLNKDFGTKGRRF